MDTGDDEYFVPLQDQRVFGAGIKRKRVDFVPASTPDTALTSGHDRSKSMGDRYLSIVFNRKKAVENTDHGDMSEKRAVAISSAGLLDGITPQLCEICNLPFQSSDTVSTKTHQASITHQICLTHSYPPSSLDRTRPGLKYLTSYGWDPDSRLGLGAVGEGIREPIKGKLKNDTLGLGVNLKPRDEKKLVMKATKLDAGRVRKSEEAEKRKGERLRMMFYQSNDIERYLGTSF